MANGLTEVDTLAIVQAIAANGASYEKVAKAFGLTAADVRSVINQAAGDRLSGEALRRELLLEVTRLDQLLTKYHGKAMADAPDALASGALYHKLCERKHTLCGLNPVTGYAVQVIHSEAAPRPKTTTEEIGDVLDELRGISQRERALCDKSDEHRYNDGPALTPDEQSELSEIQRARQNKH
jgi:transposase